MAEVSKREGRAIPLLGLFARTPAGYRRSFQEIRAQLDGEGVRTLSTALSDKEAFRALFARGGGLSGLNRRQVSGVAAARDLVAAYALEVRSLFPG